MTATLAAENDDDPTYTHFAHQKAFFDLLQRFLTVDVGRAPTPSETEDEEGIVHDLGAILDHYLPLPGLLDPHIDHIIPPLMDVLSRQVVVLSQEGLQPDAERLNRLGRVINWVVKVRGRKAVVQHFPSAISFLPQLVCVLSPPTSPSSSSTPQTSQHPLIASDEAWEVRAVLVLWLTLLLTVPFSLSALSSATVEPSLYGIDLPASKLLFSAPTSDLAKRVILLSLPLLRRSGKEGAYAALALARVFSRTDAVQGLAGFLEWAGAELAEGEREGEANFVAAILEFLALLPSMLPPTQLPVLQHFTGDVLLPHLRRSRTAAGSGLIRKLAIKAQGRWWLAWLAAHPGKASDGLEEHLDDLMIGLADKDTIVRYSSAKYLARITAILPPDLASQLVSATIDLFQGTEDEPVIETAYGTILDPGGSNPGGTMGFGGSETNRGEARWHGVCLALAEMARRGLVKDDSVEQAVPWILKALSFDIRRATHSIGSNVRDAASYVLWSLSRACPPAVLGPFANDIAVALICAACFDREVGVRRAASAAFQEGVGRLGLYPEGIDVLAKSDFYSVSVRRIAFSTAAPAIAVHAVYRSKMRNHLHNITLRHWDEAMRVLGAVALKDIVSLGDEGDLADSINREVKQLASLDPHSVHGGLSALKHLSKIPTTTDQRSKIFFALDSIRPAALISPAAGMILRSACEVICATLNADILQSEGHQRILDQYIESSMRRREPECQEAVADVFGSLGRLRGAGKEAIKLLSDLKATRAVQRQASVLSLGHIQYDRCAGVAQRVVVGLLAQLALDTKADVETRRYAIRSVADIAVQVDMSGDACVSTEQLHHIVNALLGGLSDYSTDQRGDVGSWIRIAALDALGLVISHLAARHAHSQSLPIGADLFRDIIAGIVKLLVEKLEPVRSAAARCWAKLRSANVDQVWEWAEGRLIDTNFKEPFDESFRYNDQKEWFGRCMPLLRTRYRAALVGGLVLCIGSQIESVSNMAFEPFQAFCMDLTAHGPTAAARESLAGHNTEDIEAIMAENIGSNRVFIPCLVTASKMFRSNQLSSLMTSVSASKSCNRMIALSSRGVASIKAIERISAGMRLAIAALYLRNDTVRPDAMTGLRLYLGHRYPRIRSMCAEQLYIALSDLQDDLDPDLEDLLLGTTWTEEVSADLVQQVISLVEVALR